MTLPVVVVRPEPGARATAARLAAAGLDAVIAPLFAIGPLPWTPPDPADFDALLLTSANALRHGGAGLDAYRQLPTWGVGAVTAEAAQAAGFAVEHVGSSDAASMLADPAAAGRRWLWLTGVPHQPLTVPPGATLRIMPVYIAVPLPFSTAVEQALASPAILLVHSAAAAQRLAALVPDRALHHLVAISPATAVAAGPGWRSVAAVSRPDDAEMVAFADTLCQNVRHG